MIVDYFNVVPCIISTSFHPFNNNLELPVYKYSFTGYEIDKNDNLYYLKKNLREKYLLWFITFSDSDGLEISSCFYPRNPKLGEYIKVYFRNYDKTLNHIIWKHGELGLFNVALSSFVKNDLINFCCRDVR